MTTTTRTISDDLRKAHSLVHTIEVWPHWEEIALCAQKEYGLTPAQFQERLLEYQRFLALCAIFPGIGMISAEIDQLWHAHILHTALYEAFCATVIGQKIHHLPCSSYRLYGVDPAQANDDCTTCKLPSIPTTCYGKRFPGESQEEMRQSILEGGQHFQDAYQAVFGELPAIWNRSRRPQIAEGMAFLERKASRTVASGGRSSLATFLS